MNRPMGLCGMFLCSLVIGGLQGCDTQPQTVPAPPSAAASAAAKPAASSQVDLSPWKAAKINWRQLEGASISILAEDQTMFRGLQPHLPAFEQLTGIHVGMQLEEEEAMRAKRTVDLSSRGAVYDIVTVGITELGQAHSNNWLVPLHGYMNDPSLTDSQWYDFADFSPNSIANCKIGETLLSVPVDFTAPIFFYRKDLFDKYHLAPPDTYEDLVALKRKLHAALEADNVKDVYTFTTRGAVGAGLNPWTIIPIIRAYGGEMFDEQWRPIFNSAAAVKALDTYRDMITGHGSPPDSRTQHFLTDRKMFQEGKLASGILASHAYTEYLSPDKSPIWNKWDAAPMPRGPVSRASSPWSWAYAINASSRNQKAAWLFIEWATSKEMARLLTAGSAPARRSVWESANLAEKYPPGLLKAIRWIMAEATNSPAQMGLPEYPEAGLAASKAFSEILYGAPAQQTLDRAVQQVEKIMQNGPTRKGMAAKAAP